MLASPSDFAFESNPLLLAEHHTELALLFKLRYSELKPSGHLVLHLLESFHPARSVFHPEVAEKMKAAGLIPDDI